MFVGRRARSAKSRRTALALTLVCARARTKLVKRIVPLGSNDAPPLDALRTLRWRDIVVSAGWRPATTGGRCARELLPEGYSCRHTRSAGSFRAGARIQQR